MFRTPSPGDSLSEALRKLLQGGRKGVRLYISLRQRQTAVWTSKIRYQIKEFSILCMGRGKPLGSMSSFLHMHLSYLGPILFLCSPCFLHSPSSSAIIVGDGSICWISVWGAFFHFWRPEITDGCDISCWLIWQEIFSFHTGFLNFKVHVNHLGYNIKIQWGLNSMHLNFEGTLTWEFFSVVNTTVLHSLWSLESKDAELCSGGISIMESWWWGTHGFLTVWRLGIPHPYVVHRSNMLTDSIGLGWDLKLCIYHQLPTWRYWWRLSPFFYNVNEAYGRKWRGTKKPPDESERGEWKSWIKAQHSENKDLSIWSHHFMGNRRGNSVRLYFVGLQNHCRWWLQPWN